MNPARFPGRTHPSNKLLVRLLALLRRVGAAASRLGFGFRLCRVALCLRLVLLGLALASEVVATCHTPDNFLGLALDVLNDALYRFGRSLVGVRQWIPPQWRSWFGRLAPNADQQAIGPVNTAPTGPYS